MVQRLHDTVNGYRWDCVVMWRAMRGLEGRIFDDLPLAVVDRWARKERGGFDGHPEIQDAIGYALGELRARRGSGARPVQGEGVGLRLPLVPSATPSRP